MNELKHHGILGMKWGIRRYQPYGEGGYNPKNKGKEIGEAAKTNSKKIRSYKDLSDEELQTIIDRKKLEKNYYDNVIAPTKVKTGKDIVKEYASKAAKSLVDAAIDKGSKAIVATVVKRVAQDEVFKAVYPKK